MKKLLAGTGLAGVLISLSPGAWAQDANTPTQSATEGSDEIVVVARRREERLQDVPVAVSAYTAEQRDLIGIETADDIATFTPGMTYNLATVTIRGVGRSSVSQLGADPGVANYFDGVYSDNAGSIGGAPISVERVEVLRGPQGTLFGRNSTAGAINIISRRPSDEFEGELRLRASDNESFRTQVSLSGPVTEDLRYRLEGSYNHRGPSVENLSGEGRNDEDEISASLQVEWDVTNDIQLWVRYANATYPNAHYLGPTRVDPYETSVYFTGSIPNPHYGYTVDNPGSPDDPYVVDENFSSVSRIVNTPLYAVNLDWDLGNTRLRYITGGYRAKILFDYDADYSSRVGYLSPGTSTFISSDLRTNLTAVLSSDSHELQWMSDSPGRLSWIVGVYQGHDENGGAVVTTAPFQPELENAFDLGTFGFTANPNREYIDIYSFVEGDTHAAFAQADYQLTPEWTVTAGYRHTWDEKSVLVDGSIVFFEPDVGPFGGFFGPVVLLPFAQTDEDEWDGSTMRLGLRWEPSPDTMLYGSVSDGYKAGGFNTSIPVGVDEERVVAYEVGYKGRTGDVQLNAALFYNDYEDLQVAVPVIPTDYGGSDASPTDVLFNAQQAITYGFEAETIWNATDSLRFLINYAYLSGTIEEFTEPLTDPNDPGAGAQDVSGRDLPRAPRNKVALNALYTTNFVGGELLLSGTYTWIDEQYTTFFQTSTYHIPAHDEVALRATWVSPDESYRIMGYVDNLFEEVYPLGIGLAAYSSDLARTWVPADPRTFGVELQVNF